MATHHASFDIVIIGGGTAGLVLAARLSEDPSIQVAVLEAGEDKTTDPRVSTPAMWIGTLNSEVDWAYKTKKQVLASLTTIDNTLSLYARANIFNQVNPGRTRPRLPSWPPPRWDEQHQQLPHLPDLKVPH